MISRKTYDRLKLQKQENSDGVFKIKLFEPLNIYLEKYYDRRLPPSDFGYVRIFGNGLRELYFPIVQLDDMDLNFFNTLVMNEMITIPGIN